MKFIHKFEVSPPQASVPDSSISLTFLDIIWIDSHPVHRCFFYSYSHSTSYFLESYLPNIKSSLSLTLQHFYPLAGKVYPSLDSTEELQICYKEGDSVSLDIKESGDSFHDLSGIKPRDCSKIQSLVPELNDSNLLAIQLTVFPNHGICIGFSIHHVACDGFSSTHFIKSWATICKSGLPLPGPMVPSFNRTTLPNLDEYYLSFIKRRQEFNNTAHISETKTATISTIFRISLEQIERLKMSVLAKSKQLQKTLPYCSTYIVSAAYAWSCHVKMRKYSDDQKVCFPLPVDWRRRLKPPAPSMYFGNCVMFSFAVMKAGDLIKDEGVTLACEALGMKIKELENGIESIIKIGQEGRANILAGNPIFTIAGSNRFGVYGVDFGWGQPTKVEMVINKEGLFMAENGDESTSVEIGVVLPKHEMQKFITIFAEGLALHSDM